MALRAELLQAFINTHRLDQKFTGPIDDSPVDDVVPLEDQGDPDDLLGLNTTSWAGMLRIDASFLDDEDIPGVTIEDGQGKISGEELAYMKRQMEMSLDNTDFDDVNSDGELRVKFDGVGDDQITGEQTTLPPDFKPRPEISSHDDKTSRVEGVFPHGSSEPLTVDQGFPDLAPELDAVRDPETGEVDRDQFAAMWYDGRNNNPDPQWAPVDDLFAHNPPGKLEMAADIVAKNLNRQRRIDWLNSMIERNRRNKKGLN